MSARVVSLLPSATEIVAGIGAADRLVGRSHECDFPAGVERLPVLTRSKVRKEGGSAEIHRDVEAILERSLGVYHVDAELLRRLGPTHVVTQVQCDVCAVSLADVESALAGWVGGAPALLALAPFDLESVMRDVRAVGRFLDREREGDALAARMARELEAIRRAAQQPARRPTVGCIEWLAPLMAAGNWMPELVEIAGGTDLFGRPGEHSPWLEWDRLLAADPEVLVIIPCGFPIGRIGRDLHLLTRDPRWASLRAVAGGRVYAADGNQFFNRPGPRIVESARILAEILHPEAFAPDRAGSAWKRVGTGAAGTRPPRGSGSPRHAGPR
ncbi:MAG TPA: ABC transporter substrate-binding protein [Thermoanaerobaculia bacterium]|nr:ABC transporter substrate-binding protein [Thermoanaerobaculia bacterium]